MKRVLYGDPKTVAYVEERTGGTWGATGAPWSLGLEQDGNLIAGVVFDSWNGASLCIHVAADPGARWMTREYLFETFRYPFEVVKCKKLIGLVGSGNLEAIRFDKHLGFVCEATLPDAHPDGALLIFSMTPEQCKWLRRGKDGKEQFTAA